MYSNVASDTSLTEATSGVSEQQHLKPNFQMSSSLTRAPVIKGINMQFYSGDWKLGIKSKSHMAEFASNPDSRLKKDVSYNEYLSRKKYEDDLKNKDRILINKKRKELGFKTFFDNQEKFEEIIDDTELIDEELINFLINYKI